MSQVSWCLRRWPFALREKRLKRLMELGMVAPDVVPHEVVMAPEGCEWDGFSEYEKQCSIRAMEAYAGMVDQMDHNIGKVLDYLKHTGEYDNTMIVFMSDNGAEGAAYVHVRCAEAALTGSIEAIREWQCHLVDLNR